MKLKYFFLIGALLVLGALRLVASGRCRGLGLVAVAAFGLLAITMLPVSPFICSATSSAAICTSVAWPVRICDMTWRASSRLSEMRWFAILWMASVIMAMNG